MTLKLKSWPHIPNVIKSEYNTYQIGEYLGEGTFAKCYKVLKKNSNMSENSEFACKAIFIRELLEEDMLSIENEIKILKKLNDDKITKLHDTIKDENYCYLILDLCENGSLLPFTKRKVKESELCYIAHSTLLGLRYLRTKNIIHNDIKPENILLSQNGIKLADFGLSEQFEEGQEGVKDVKLGGTWLYYAPEMLTFKKQGSLIDYDCKVDVWALGILLYYLAFRKHPFLKWKKKNSKSNKVLPDNYKINKDKYIKFRQGTLKSLFKDDISIPDNNTFSCCFVEFLKTLLEKDPKVRPSAEALLQHPFLQGEKTAPELGKEGEKVLKRKVPDTKNEPVIKKNKLFKIQKSKDSDITINDIKLKNNNLDSTKHKLKYLNKEIIIANETKKVKLQETIVKIGKDSGMFNGIIEELTELKDTKIDNNNNNNEITYYEKYNNDKNLGLITPTVSGNLR